LPDFEGERKEERGKKKGKSKVMVRDTFIMGKGGRRPSITLLEGSQAPTARLSGTSSRKIEVYEEGKKRLYRMVT